MPTNFPSNPAQLKSTLQRLEPECLRFLEELVRVNSFSGNAAGVNANADRIVRQFQGWGLSERRVPCQDADAGEHLILDSGGDGPVIACISHLDTVFPPEEEIQNGFAWQVEGSRAFGPGTFDIKGGTAMLWLMLATLREDLPDLWKQFRWILLWNAAEERLVPDFTKLCLETLPENTRACLVFEGDNRKSEENAFGILESRKGMAKFHFRVEGRGAHAGSSHPAGANAIHELSRRICQVQEMTDYTKDLTVSVGKIQGGTVSNRVPHEAEAWLEMRAFDPAVFQSVRQQILALAGVGEISAATDGFSCRIEVEDEGGMPPWEVNASTLGLVEIWKSAAQELGHSLDSSRRGGVSDANPMASLFPTLDALGPRGGNAHASERSADGSKIPEHVDLSSFVPKAHINLLALAKLGVE